MAGILLASSFGTFWQRHDVHDVHDVHEEAPTTPTTSTAPRCPLMSQLVMVKLAPSKLVDSIPDLLKSLVVGGSISIFAYLRSNWI